MRLNEIQQAYAQAIYSGDSKALEDQIFGTENFPKSSRVNIYRNNTLGALKDALRSVYPVCVALVGEDYFNQLANVHVSEYPSTDRNLDFYGEQFPVTLQNLIDTREELQSLAYLADVAKLEWCLHEIYYAADRAPFDYESFAKLTAEQQTRVRFKLAADVRLLHSAFPVYDIWLSHQDDSHDINNEQVHRYILFYRETWKPEMMQLDQNSYELLMAMQRNTPLLELTDLLEKSPIDIAALIQKGLVAGFETE